MRPDSFERLSGIVAALPAANIDTDVIMPKAFLRGIDRSGLDKGVFHDLRFDEAGRARPDFVLNQKAWKGAKFLVTGANFGCGSSREHAVWGLLQFGIRAIIAPSFAGIFFDNCGRNGLLAIEASEADAALISCCAQAAGTITVDLPTQRIETPEGEVRFPISERRKTMLLNGLDAVGMTLKWRNEIESFQTDYLGKHPWLR